MSQLPGFLKNVLCTQQDHVIAGRHGQKMPFAASEATIL